MHMSLRCLRRMKRHCYQLMVSFNLLVAFTPITTDLGISVTDSATTFSVTGISSITSGDIIKVDNEFMKITNVGLGTTHQDLYQNLDLLVF